MCACVYVCMCLYMDMYMCVFNLLVGSWMLNFAGESWIKTIVFSMLWKGLNNTWIIFPWSSAESHLANCLNVVFFIWFFIWFFKVNRNNQSLNAEPRVSPKNKCAWLKKIKQKEGCGEWSADTSWAWKHGLAGNFVIIHDVH